MWIKTRLIILLIAAVCLPSPLWGVGGLSQDSIMAQALRDMGDVPFYDGCSMTLLPSGVEKYEALFADVREAREYVHMEYFKFYNDCIGGELLHLLHQKAQQGVDVRILVDGFGNKNKQNQTFSPATLDSLRALGIHISIYKPIRGLQFWRYFHRDHRKICVIDGRVGYLGGMNVADYYLVGKPKVGDWHDMHVRVEGSVVEGLEDIFKKMWHPLTGSAGLRACVSEASVSQARRPAVPVRMALVNRSRGRLSSHMRRAMAMAFEVARDSVCLVNPYPTNIPYLRRAMYRALRRGVKIKIIVSGKSDISVTPDVVAIEMRRLMRRGAEVYYCEKGFHHDKYMTVDGRFATVGTANLDGRSLRFDLEANLFVFSPHYTEAFNQQFRYALKDCTLLTPEGFRQRFSLGHRMIGRVAGVFRVLF